MHLLVLYSTFDKFYTSVHKRKENKPLSEVKKKKASMLKKNIFYINFDIKIDTNFKMDMLTFL